MLCRATGIYTIVVILGGTTELVCVQVPGPVWAPAQQPRPAVPTGWNPQGFPGPGVPNRQEEEERRRNLQLPSHLRHAAPHAARCLADTVRTTWPIERRTVPIPPQVTPAQTKAMSTLTRDSFSSLKSAKPTGISGWAKGVMVGIIAAVAGLFKLLFSVLDGSRKES